MRVLLIDVNCKYSSTGKIVYDLYTELNTDGHKAAVCYGRGPLITEPNIYKFSSNIEVYIHAFLTRLTGLTGCYSFFATRNLLKFIKKFKPDVVHLHELHAYFVNLAPLINYLKSNHIKTVWTFHCEFMYTGKCGHASECDGWKNECGKCPQLKEYPASLLFDFTKKMLKEKKRLFYSFDNLTIVTPSKWLADRVKQSFLSNKDIRVIYNGIDTENIFYPRDYKHLKVKYNIKDEKIVLAVAPNLMQERKGGKAILELAKKIREEKIKFILIGVDKLNEKFDQNVIALGRIDNQKELAEYYSLADVFVILSKRENFPTTCIESLSCGTPIVGFDVGGTKETAPGGLGHFVNYGDIKELRDSVVQSLGSKINIQNECVEYGRQNYSKQKMYTNYLSLYLN